MRPQFQAALSRDIGEERAKDLITAMCDSEAICVGTFPLHVHASTIGVWRPYATIDFCVGPGDISRGFAEKVAFLFWDRDVQSGAVAYSSPGFSTSVEDRTRAISSGCTILGDSERLASPRQTLGKHIRQDFMEMGFLDPALTGCLRRTFLYISSDFGIPLRLFCLSFATSGRSNQNGDGHFPDFL